MKSLVLLFFVLLTASFTLSATTVRLECTCEYNMGEISLSLSREERDTQCFRKAVPSEEWDAAHHLVCDEETCQCLGLLGVYGAGDSRSEAQSNARDSCRASIPETAGNLQVIECKAL